MAEKSIEDRIFIKQCVDEYSYLTTHQPFMTGYIRRVPGSAMRGTGLKEISVILRSEIGSCSNELMKLINAYKARFNITGSITDVTECLEKDLRESYSTPAANRYIGNPFSQAVSGINYGLKIINSQIDFVRTIYKVSDTNDERWNNATVSSIIHAETASPYDSSECWCDIDKIEAEMKAAKVNTNSAEYGKLIIKRLNTFKADMISAFNKYYGKNSVFAELHLSDMIRY